MDLDRDRDFVSFSSRPLKVNFERKNNHSACDKGFCRTGIQNVQYIWYFRWLRLTSEILYLSRSHPLFLSFFLSNLTFSLCLFPILQHSQTLARSLGFKSFVLSRLFHLPLPFFVFVPFFRSRHSFSNRRYDTISFFLFFPLFFYGDILLRYYTNKLQHCDRWTILFRSFCSCSLLFSLLNASFVLLRQSSISIANKLQLSKIDRDFF